MLTRVRIALMNTTTQSAAKSVAILWPGNFASNRHRVIGFFREAAADGRITAVHIDVELPNWKREFAALARGIRFDYAFVHYGFVEAVRPQLDRLPYRPRLVSHRPHTPTGINFMVDNAAVGTVAAKFFLKRGILNLGYLGIEREAIHSLPRGRAFCRTAIHGGANTCRKFVWTQTPGNTAKLLAYLTALPKPCGIFAYNDFTARNLLTFCRIHGFAVPDTIAILGADDDESLCEAATPSLSSVAIDFYTYGHYACRLIRDGARAAKATPPPAPPKIHERDSTRPANSHSRIVIGAQNLIHRQRGKISVRELAQALHVSERMLHLSFVKVLGHGPKTEINNHRLEAAKKLLKTTRLTINEIAADTGFATASNLHRAFARAFGCSPTAYRERAAAARCRRAPTATYGTSAK